MGFEFTLQYFYRKLGHGHHEGYAVEPVFFKFMFS